MSAIQTWGVDAPSTGAYKSHEVADVFKPAGHASLLFNLASKRQLKSGEALTVAAYEHLDFPDSTELDEEDSVPLSKLSITAKTISMSERGRAVAITGKTINRSPIDVLQAHRDAMSEFMKRELEEVIATALKTMPVKYVLASATTQTITSNGTPGAAAGSNPNVYHMQTIGSYLGDTLRVPVDSRYGAYVGVFRGNGLLGIMRDSEFRVLNTGLGLAPIAQQKLAGQIGEIMVFKHNDSRVLSNTKNSVYSEGFVMGDQAVLFGFIEQLGLKYDFSVSKATEFGRFKYIALTGDYGAGLFSDSANAGLVRGVHISSNA